MTNYRFPSCPKLACALLLAVFVVFYNEDSSAQNAAFSNSFSRKIDHVKIAMDEKTVTEWYKSISDFGGLELRLVTSRKDLAGNNHYKFKQYFQSLPVQKSMMNIHVNSGGIYYVNGMLFPTEDAAITPNISKEEATKIAISLIEGTHYAWQDTGMQVLLRDLENNQSASYYPSPMLCYVPDLKEAKVKLAYQVDIYCLIPLQKKRLFVDALDGSLIAEEELLHSISTSGKAHTLYSGIKTIICDSVSPTLFHLTEDTRGEGIATYNAQKTHKSSTINFSDNDNVWDNVNADRDEVATDIHWGLEMTYDYYKDKLSRNSYDDKGKKLIAMAHVGVKLNNAFFDGKMFFFGDGDDITDNPYGSLDICGHEVTHGLTKETADLYYMDEMGALNESFSDIFGKCVEYYYASATFNWKQGDAVRKSGIGIRDMKNPNATSMPKYYRGKYYYTGTVDYGGVHTNSNVQNFWFYLLCEGGSGTRELDGAPFIVSPIGLAKAEQIAYSNLADYLFPLAQFSDAATNSLMAAESLYGLSSGEYNQVKEAWYAVGVLDAPTNIIALNGSKSARVFPNPAVNMLTIEYNIEDDAQMNIYNGIGQSIMSVSLSHKSQSKTISIDNLNAGIYFGKLSSKNGAVSLVKFCKL